MAKSKEDEMLEHLSEDIDNALIKWVTTYEIPPLNLTAVILARLTWMAKMGDYREDFLQLLKSPENVLDDEDDEKVVH
jgi:hypothetical protein